MKAGLREIQKLCEPLFELKPVMSVWLFGSWTTGRKTRKSDIDILILIDDTNESKEVSGRKLDAVLRQVRKKAKSRGLNLHFQSPKMLSSWWDMIREGEPWTITSIRTAKPLYDPSSFITLMQRLLKRGELFSIEDKVQRLLERATENMNSIRELMVDDLTYELLMIAADSAQAVLIYAGEYPPEPEHVHESLRRVFLPKGMLREGVIEIYEELAELRRKVIKGVLNEFTGSDLDRYMKRVDYFVSEMEKLMGRLQGADDEKELKDMYEKYMEICRQVLRKRLRRSIPRDDLRAIEKFRKHFVDTGLVDRSHYRALLKLYKYHKSKKPRRMQYVQLKGLELVLKEFMK